MDDWPKTLTEWCWLRKKYWDKTIEKKLQIVLDSSYKLLTISEGMKEEYQKRYGKTSDVFHNPVEVESWLPFKTYPIHKNSQLIKILYTGRIGKANSSSIFLLIKAIDIIRNQLGRRIELHIFSPNSLHLDTRTKEFVHIKQSVPHSAMPELLQNSDILFLPLDFDKLSIQFAKLSMPTKATEYMISGTPVLLFAPQETHLFQHALKNNWAKVVSEFSLKALVDTISFLIDNEEIRLNYASNAKELVLKNYDIKIVNKRFEQVFIL
jgi:glycosyltransferase involved in cell wall biosynthesis